MKVRLVIEYDEHLDGDASARWMVLHPIDFPIGPAALLGILEVTKDTILHPGDEGESFDETDAEFDEFRRKLNALIDEFDQS